MNTNEYEKWKDLIGEFMVLFAHIEFDVINALLEFTGDGYEKYEYQGLRKRLSKLDSIVFKMPVGTPTQKILHGVIAELEELTDTRNLIAHNPTSLPLDSIFNDIPDLEIRAFQDEDDVVTRQELKRQLGRLSDVSEILHNTLGVASMNLHIINEETP